METKIKKIIQNVIFASKWLLIPFYLVLFWTLAKLLYHFVFEGHLTNEDLLSTLENVDIVMIANLVKMIITGSYNSFVDRDHGIKNENITSGYLKVKMATSIIGVSSIHLLQSFINAENISPETFVRQLWIHGIFIVGAIGLALIDYLHGKTENH